MSVLNHIADYHISKKLFKGVLFITNFFSKFIEKCPMLIVGLYKLHVLVVGWAYANPFE